MRMCVRYCRAPPLAYATTVEDPIAAVVVSWRHLYDQIELKSLSIEASRCAATDTITRGPYLARCFRPISVDPTFSTARKGHDERDGIIRSSPTRHYGSTRLKITPAQGPVDAVEDEKHPV